jgi:hypothetical protein
MPVKNNSKSSLSRMQGKFVIDIETGCHNWTGSRSSQGRYPTVSIEGSKRPVYAYRLSWEAINGPMPTTAPPDGSDRWEFHHQCENKGCVNGKHVQLVTRKEHAQIHKGIRAAQKKAKVAA